ncbi:MAG: BMC domain-containing protein [Burkholderiaceae bacterium]|nr:BMC domain-containing protein [Burkholderiaceae bacterium]
MSDGLHGTALGFVETIGKAAGMHAADAMVKAANVTLQTAQQPGGGIITVIVRGEVGAVQAAIEAGAVAARSVGKVRAVHLIARPHEEIEAILERPPVR